MSLAMRGVFGGLRVVAVVRHDTEHLEIGLAGTEGTWTDADGTVSAMSSATMHLFPEDDGPDARERHRRNEGLLTAWRDEDTPIVGLQLAVPAPRLLLLDEASQRFINLVMSPPDGDGSDHPY
jgi:hypothetical protein